MLSDNNLRAPDLGEKHIASYSKFPDHSTVCHNSQYSVHFMLYSQGSMRKMDYYKTRYDKEPGLIPS